MRVMGVKGLTLYHLKSHLQACSYNERKKKLLYFNSYISCIISFLNIFINSWLLICNNFLSRNSDLGSSHTRNSTITRLRMVRESKDTRIYKNLFLTTSVSCMNWSCFLGYLWSASALDLQRNAASSSGIMGRTMNE